MKKWSTVEKTKERNNKRKKEEKKIDSSGSQLSKIYTKIKNILTRWTVAQGGVIVEEKLEVKNLATSKITFQCLSKANLKMSHVHMEE